MLTLMELSITEKLEINLLCGEVLQNSDPATNYKTPDFFPIFIFCQVYKKWNFFVKVLIFSIIIHQFNIEINYTPSMLCENHASYLFIKTVTESSKTNHLTLLAFK